jgi:hypothetical protein
MAVSWGLARMIAVAAVMPDPEPLKTSHRAAWAEGGRMVRGRHGSGASRQQGWRGGRLLPGQGRRLLARRVRVPVR